MARAPSSGVGPPGFIEPTFGQRLIGALLDGLVLLPVALLLAAAGSGAITRGIGLAITSTYHIGLTARNGQTLGKRVVGTRVVDHVTGAFPSWRQAGVRWLILGVGAVVIDLLPVPSAAGLFYAVAVLAGVLIPPLHRGLHDRAASTVVRGVAGE